MTSFKVASYNIENLFDLDRSGREYGDYIPFKKSRWNTQAFNKKLTNLTRVIKDMNPDIIALQEVESKKALKTLNRRLQYPHSAIAQMTRSPVRVAILSRYPIQKEQSIFVKSKFRDILKVELNIKGLPFILYINHWPSKRQSEKFRIAYAKALKKDLLKETKPVSSS